MRSGEHSSGLPNSDHRALLSGAQAAAAAVDVERQPVAVLVGALDDAGLKFTIAAAGRSGIEEVYGVPYLDVGCDVCFDVYRVHHFSPLITAIRREQ